MAIDNFTDLPGIISELQDGGLQIFEANTAPSMLIIGNATSGTVGTPVQVTRTQDIELLFGKEGNLIRGMYEAKAGGSQNTYVMRIGASSAILSGVGTDDQAAEPTLIETLLKDVDAASMYSIRYTPAAALGPNAELGHLIIKNATGLVVYNNNPGGQILDAGELLVSGEFVGGIQIGNILDEEDFIGFEVIAQDALAAEAEEIGTMTSVGPESFALDNENVKAGTHVVFINGEEIARGGFEVTTTANVDTVEVGLAGELAVDDIVTVSYQYDADSSINLKRGTDGVNLPEMEYYQAVEEALLEIENDNFNVISVMGAKLDTLNTEDGDTVTIYEDEKIPVGQRFPKAGSKTDGLGRMFKEEFEGEFFYFWDINGDAKAEIYPTVGSASATTKIDGSDLEESDFHEVNFAYQLADFCYRASSNEYNVSGVIATSMPKSYSKKEISLWIGKEPVSDVDGKIIANGTGLLGNKFLAGRTNYAAGLWATPSTFLPGAGGDAAGSVEKDRGGRAIDIGRYISVVAGVNTFFNNVDTTGYGYNANGATFYGAFYTTLASQSAPTNKIATGAYSPFKLSKTKLNSLAKFSLISYKEKNGVLRFSDSPTAARKDSDFRRLTTNRVTSEIIDIVRNVAEPYIGEPNTENARKSLDLNLRGQIGKAQELGVIQRFEVLVSATVAQQIEGDATVELIIVPPYELRKIRVITSLAKQ